MSIIITIIINITVLVSHSVICFGCFMRKNHSANKHAPLVVSPLYPSPLPGFQQVCLLLYKQYFINIFWLWSNYCKKLCIFKVKQFFFSAYCWSVLILLFWLYVFLRTLFHISVIIKLRIASCLHICIASYLASHQIMWHKQKNSWPWFENYKLLLFLRFPR